MTATSVLAGISTEDTQQSLLDAAEAISYLASVLSGKLPVTQLNALRVDLVATSGGALVSSGNPLSTAVTQMPAVYVQGFGTSTLPGAPMQGLAAALYNSAAFALYNNIQRV